MPHPKFSSIWTKAEILYQSTSSIMSLSNVFQVVNLSWYICQEIQLLFSSRNSCLMTFAESRLCFRWVAFSTCSCFHVDDIHLHVYRCPFVLWIQCDSNWTPEMQRNSIQLSYIFSWRIALWERNFLMLRNVCEKSNKSIY